ncbi:hypothetical protein Tco_0928574, partial [Tanacetum coccineum]
MTKVIKEEFEKLEDLKIKDVSLTCDTSLEVFNNEFNRLNGMDDNLFTYEVEVANIPCDSNMDDDSEHDADDDMGYVMFHLLNGNDEVEITDEESSDNEDEVAEVLRIDDTTGSINGTRTCHGYMAGYGLIMEYGRNQHQSNTIANLSIITLDVRNGQPV